MEFMLACSLDKDTDEVAVEACDFWHSVADIAAAHPALRAVLPRLLPVLLDSIVYDEDDFEVRARSGRGEGGADPARGQLLDIHKADETVADSTTDLRPQFHDARTAGQVRRRPRTVHTGACGG
jgi:transportin-1